MPYSVDQQLDITSAMMWVFVLGTFYIGKGVFSLVTEVKEGSFFERLETVFGLVILSVFGLVACIGAVMSFIGLFFADAPMGFKIWAFFGGGPIVLAVFAFLILGFLKIIS